MEATQSYPNLLSEKQAARRLGVARITLLRAREAGRIRFFRIGTRVLYCVEQLTEFLSACERNSHMPGGETTTRAVRRQHGISSGRGTADRQTARLHSTAEPKKKNQASLPFTANR
ncbi:MAG TPA: helix-turn-helix domain-containing protein [Pyrinomonadaceae bacterium]|jgi:excisionase family DNA binding protein|nr:helix-turn-helix domain-containing protein [Pyrinomonadaceae bacterium]